MVSFSYLKLYAELVAGDGTVLVAYVTRLRVAGLEKSSAGFELYAPDGSRRVVHALAPARVERRPGSLVIELETADGRFELSSSGSAPSAHSPSEQPARALAWQVLIDQGAAGARLVADGRARFALTGSGYADEVNLGRPPRALGLRRIRWGRAHVAQSSLVFNELCFEERPPWKACWDGSSWSSDFTLIDGSNGLVEVARKGDRLRLSGDRDLHEGPAVDRARFPGTTERLVARAFTGRIAEVRRLSNAERGSDRGAALHEDVRLS
jgi:hypothetical protein